MPDFSKTIADRICERLAGGESLRLICGSGRAKGLPGQTTVYRWLAENEAFQRAYALAREAQADLFIDQILAIADGEGEDARDAARDRLRIDTRKWVAAKLAPRKYGEKVALTGGADADPPIRIEDDRMAAARIAAILEAARVRRDGHEGG
jgi:hypothetical protein